MFFIHLTRSILSTAFEKNCAVLLSGKIKSEFKQFDSKSFIEEVDKGTNDLELKDRVELIADKLKERLPEDYNQSMQILTNILGPENEKETGMFTEGYWIMPIAKFVEKYGLDNYKDSIKAIKEITKRNTGEYCIRPFIEKYPDRSLDVIKKWSNDKNVHVRRLSSEGIRPRLPWAAKLQIFIENPKPILPILDNLKDDPSKFVQKSVANNINDILKDNYEIGIKTLSIWTKGATPQRRWIIKHALRNQIKHGNSQALKIVSGL